MIECRSKRNQKKIIKSLQNDMKIFDKNLSYPSIY